MRMYHYLALAMGVVGLAVPAAAAQYNFSFTPSQNLFGSSFSGSGIFTTAETSTQVGGQTAFAITSITGTVGGSAIVAPTKGSYGNYFTTGSYFLDGSGVNFSTANGRLVSLFNQSSNNIYRVNSQSPGSSFFVNATSSAVAAVPETATWAMMLVGFSAVGVSLRTRKGVRVNLA